MDHIKQDINKRPVSWAARLAVALALLGAMTSLAACGGGSDDSSTSATTGAGGAGPTAASGGTANASDKGVQYSQCMREHGIKDFPDPVDGHVLLQSGPGSDLNPNLPAFQAADKACKSLQPAGDQNDKIGSGGPGGEAVLAFAKCMRKNGVPKFPDPKINGAQVQMGIDPSSGVDPNSASFKAAQAKCGNATPGGAPSGATP
jgi:hypothetical protein